MRGSEARSVSAYGNALSLRLISRTALSTRPIWIVQRRAVSAVSTAHQTKLLEGTIPNPATSHYEDKPIYPSIASKSFGVGASISSRDLTSTRPAKLETPEPLKPADFGGNIPIGDRAKWFYRLGRSYLAFYKTGFKNVWYNYKELRKIKQRVARGGRRLEDAVKYGSPRADDSKGNAVPVLSRKDYQMALRTRHDLGKLVPFSIVFAICGEFTPLVILAIGSAAVPYTCRIPKQEQGDFLRPVKIQPKYVAQVDKLQADMAKDGNDIQWKQEFLEAYRLHVNPLPYPIPILGQIWHTLYSRPGLRKHCEEVLCDTILIQREGGFQKLSPRDVFEWSLKYGLKTLRDHIADLQQEGKTIDPDSPKLKSILVPAAEAEAEYMLNVDWKRVKPENHWLAVFRPILPERAVTPRVDPLTER
ncbi:hypothetical protein H2200_001109 [Cladophialophora chaetospira]|uniref:Letm1 RBD domain-containing protein n=1 Tax=Cladophialophora chaetospira TaxID=386627 RepID=A0AA38XL21_9EURO|nr:hypothetical protein H2200_001109 [Cladophialophora chaetospira]